MVDILISICEPAVLCSLILVLFAFLFCLNCVTIRLIYVLLYSFWTGQSIPEVLDALRARREAKQWK